MLILTFRVFGLTGVDVTGILEFGDDVMLLLSYGYCLLLFGTLMLCRGLGLE